MADISIVDSHYVISKGRLDAEYYKSSFLEIEKNLSKLHCERLKNLVESIKKGIFYILAEEYQARGVPFLRVSNIGNPFIEKKDLVCISPEKNQEHKSTSLKPEDIVISKGGTIGYVGIITPDIGICNICQDIIGVKNVKKTKVSPYFLAIFLLTKYGQNQLHRGRSQQVQAHLTLDVVRNLLVPILSKDFQLHIEQLVKQAYEKRKLAEQKYQQAEEKLYELLGISKEEIEKLEAEKAYETNFKEVKKTLRFDAEHYHPKYLGVLNLLRKTPFELKSLKEIAKIKHKKVNPEEEPYRTNKIKYIEIGGIDTAFGEIIEYTEEYGWKLPSGGKYIVKEKDILYSKVRPYRKGIGFVTKEFEGSLVTQGFTVIRCKSESIIPEYLFLYLRSDVGNLPLLRNMSGSTYPTVKDEDIGEILVPIIPKDKQQEIANLVKEYFELRKEARQLIQKAIREVEEAIENASRSNRE